MHYEISIAKRKRTCGICGDGIAPQTKHFIQIDYPEYSAFPIRKNLCNNCIEKLIDYSFIEFLENLVLKLKKLKSGQEIKKEVPF